MDNVSGIDPLRVGPKPGESHVKECDGKVSKWYIICNQWGNHNTEQHRAMLEMAHADEEEEATNHNMKNTGWYMGEAGGSAFAGLVSQF